MAKSQAAERNERAEALREALERVERKLDYVLDRLDAIEEAMMEEPQSEAERRPPSEPGSQVH